MRTLHQKMCTARALLEDKQGELVDCQRRLDELTVQFNSAVSDFVDFERTHNPD